MSSEPALPVRVRFPDGTEKDVTLLGNAEIGDPLRTAEPVGFWVITAREAPAALSDVVYVLDVQPL